MKAFLKSLFVLACLSLSGMSHAVTPEERLDDPVKEQQARDISRQLRCLVCQNQSIDESDAGLAKDLRVLVRERLEAGDDPDAVLDYVVDIYGEFVLLKPRFGLHTALLWLSPILFLILGVGLALGLFVRRTKTKNKAR